MVCLEGLLFLLLLLILSLAVGILGGFSLLGLGQVQDVSSTIMLLRRVMTQGINESNTVRESIFIALGSHNNEAIRLQAGESLQLQFSVGTAVPTITFSGTLRASKAFDPNIGETSIAPWLEPMPGIGSGAG